jgi:hypothetical protein
MRRDDESHAGALASVLASRLAVPAMAPTSPRVRSFRLQGWPDGTHKLLVFSVQNES